MEHQGDHFLRYMATVADRIEAKRLRRSDGLGWTVQHVRPSDPRTEPYSYTVGLSIYHRPELVVYSLAERTRETLLDMVAEHMLADLQAPPPGLHEPLVLWGRHKCRITPHPRPERLRTARAYIDGMEGYSLSAWIVEPR